MGYSLSVKPFEDPALNVLEVINELFYNLILLLCFTFTEFFHDTAAKTETGYVFIAFLLTMLAINIGVQLRDTVKLIKLKMMRSWMLYKIRQKKWQKPKNLKLMSHTFSHKASVQEILQNQYKSRVFKDVFDSLKTSIFQIFKSKEGLESPLESKSNLVSIKPKFDRGVPM